MLNMKKKRTQHWRHKASLIKDHIVKGNFQLKYSFPPYIKLETGANFRFKTTSQDIAHWC